MKILIPLFTCCLFLISMPVKAQTISQIRTDINSTANQAGDEIIRLYKSGRSGAIEATQYVGDQIGVTEADARNFINEIVSSPVFDTQQANDFLDNVIAGKTQIGNVNIGSATNMIKKLGTNINASPEAVERLINNIGNGDISPQIGEALADIENLGNLQLANIESFIKDSAISGATGVIQNILDQAPSLDDLAARIPTNILGTLQDPLSELPDIADLLNQPGTIPRRAIDALMQITKISLDPAILEQFGADLIANEVGKALQKHAPGLLRSLGGLNAFQASFQTSLASSCGGKYEILPCDSKPGPVKTSYFPVCHCTQCRPAIEKNHKDIRGHITEEFIKNRNWMIDELFSRHILPAMGMMTAQLSTASVQQTKMIGKFFDAKHQLETQRLFQKLMAEAHKDYQPSEGLCEIGTSTRSLAASDRKSDLAHVAFANRMMDRNLRTNDSVSAADNNSDIDSRIELFIQKHCHKSDNGNGLNLLCQNGDAPRGQRNKDVDFTGAIESKLTLDVDFIQSGGPATADEEDLFALTANLFGHKPLPLITNRILADGNGNPRTEAYRYMDLRSVAAKRSVAQNSFAALTAERAKGDKEVAPYLNKLVTELGIADQDVENILGKEPSYFSQMEVLTKKIYQNPTFYTELYDKPANVTRKGATIRAIRLMQDRNIYESLLRSESVLSVLLETMLYDEKRRVYTNLKLIGSEQKSTSAKPKETGADDAF